MRYLTFAIVLASLLLLGCGSAEESSDATADTPAATGTANDDATEPAAEPEPADEGSDDDAASESTSGSGGTVEVGMGLMDVRSILGAPLETRHEHGPNGEEFDIWVYDDTEITILNNQVHSVETN